MVDAEHPDRIVVARNGSPVLLGVGEREMFVASDVAALVGYTRQVVYLDDGELATITAGGYRTFTLDDRSTAKSPATIDWDIIGAEIGDHAHFLQKEIAEQPRTIERTLRGRLDERFSTAHLGGLNLSVREAREFRRVKILGCGSACYAGDLGAQLIEDLARMPATVGVGVGVPLPQPGRRARHPVRGGQPVRRDRRHPRRGAGAAAQGRPGDRDRQRRRFDDRPPVRRRHLPARRPGDVGGGHQVVHLDGRGVRAAGAAPGPHARPLAERRASGSSTGCKALPAKIAEILELDDEIAKIARDLAPSASMLFIGRRRGWPVAREGAQKLKEISYIHAEAYASAELKHGPLALVSPELPTIAVVPDDDLFDKNTSTLAEIKARRGPVIAVAHRELPADLADRTIVVPKSEDELDPILMSIPLQILAYHAAVALERDVDKPRNLAKSVTVE